MTGKCEICGSVTELTRVSSCACGESFPHAFLCKDCKKKYFDYPQTPSVPYFHNWSYAENLVYAYKARFEAGERARVHMTQFLPSLSGSFFCCQCGEPICNAKLDDELIYICGCGSTEFIWRAREPHEEYNGPTWTEKKEIPTMQVSYNGFTGELVKLERDMKAFNLSLNGVASGVYTLAIYDSKKEATTTFEKVKLDDVKFLGGAVAFG